MPDRQVSKESGPQDTCRKTAIEWEVYPSCSYIISHPGSCSLTIARGQGNLVYKLYSNDTISEPFYSNQSFKVELTGLADYIIYPTRIDYRVYGHIDKLHTLFFHQAVAYIGMADTFFKVYICRENIIPLNNDTLIRITNGLNIKNHRLPKKKELNKQVYYLYLYDTRNNVIYLFKPDLCYVGMLKFYPYMNGHFQGTGSNNNIFAEMRYGMKVSNNGLRSLNFKKSSQYRRLKRFIFLTKH